MLYILPINTVALEEYTHSTLVTISEDGLIIAYFIMLSTALSSALPRSLFGRVRIDYMYVIWNEAIVMYFNTLYWHSSRGTRKKHKKKISQELQCRLRISNRQSPYYNSRV